MERQSRRLAWRLRRAHRVVQRGRVHHGHQADQPAARRNRGTEPDQPGVVGVALRHRGSPALPVRVQRRQLVHRVEPVVAGEDLGTPGRIPRPRLQQRHLGLAGGELRVERRQVGDLERHDEQADAGGDHLDHPGPAWPDETMPSVKTDDPAMPRAVAKSTPAAYHSMSPTPSTIRQSQMTNSSTMAAGPTKESTRSRVS